MKNHNLNKGDVLYCSWGYDQTNVDFYEVVDLVGKQSVRLRPIYSRRVESDTFHDRVVPCPGEYRDWDVLLSKDGTAKVSLLGEVKRVRKDGSSVTLCKGHRAYLWDGKPEYATAAGFGH